MAIMGEKNYFKRWQLSGLAAEKLMVVWMMKKCDMSEYY